VDVRRIQSPVSLRVARSKTAILRYRHFTTASSGRPLSALGALLWRRSHPVDSMAIDFRFSKQNFLAEADERPGSTELSEQLAAEIMASLHEIVLARTQEVVKRLNDLDHRLRPHTPPNPETFHTAMMHSQTALTNAIFVSASIS
jgi:hypothetical protein